MKKGSIFFNPIEGSGSLTISWSPKPKGDATEAKKGAGVGFFSEPGDLLCVIFDDVQSELDHQVLEFPNHLIEITVKNGKVTHTVTKTSESSLPIRKRRKKPTSSRQ